MCFEKDELGSSASGSKNNNSSNNKNNNCSHNDDNSSNNNNNNNNNYFGHYRSNVPADSTDESVSGASVSSRSTLSTKSNVVNLHKRTRQHTSTGSKDVGSAFTVGDLLDIYEDPDQDAYNKYSETTQDNNNHHHHHHQQHGESNGSSCKNNNRNKRIHNDDDDESKASRGSDVLLVSSLTKRLNQMTVKERENALFDLHGIPLDDEFFDRELGVQGNTIEKDPEKLNSLLLELDRLVEEQMNANVSDDEAFGEGIEIARQQNPEYVHAQRIRFLRADRYDVNLASTRMIRFFDLKRELFCAEGYNNNNETTASGTTAATTNNHTLSCMGRDLRLSDFSTQELEIWRRTGFLQLCGMRDRANRAIVAFFGKIITEEKIHEKLVMRAYLYATNLWSRDESTQKAGFVVIGYMAFNDLHLRGSVSQEQSDANEDLVDEYLTSTAPLLRQIVKVGLACQLRGISRHFCYDHPKLNAQFEKIAGLMSTFSAARFRCHYANAENLDSNLLSFSQNDDTASANDDKNNNNNYHNNKSGPNAATATTPRTQISGAAATAAAPSPQDQNWKYTINSSFNPHKELLYMLMTFGIPRDTVPVNDVTGEVNLELHRAIFEAIEERENQDRLMEEAFLAETANASTPPLPPTDVVSSSLVSAATQDSNKLWYSLTASTNSSMSFALFPDLLLEDVDVVDETVEADTIGTSILNSTERNDNSTTMTSLPASSSSSSSTNPPDKALSLSTDLESTAAAPLTSFANGIATEISTPLPNDIVMGRGPWNRKHPGNLRLKAMLERERPRYECANRFERMRIVDAMLDELYEQHNARFLCKADGRVDSTKTNHQPKTLWFEPSKPTTTGLHPKTSNDASRPWIVARRERAHNKITHDFRNLRRPKSKRKNDNPAE